MDSRTMDGFWNCNYPGKQLLSYRIAGFVSRTIPVTYDLDSTR
jgi:hypothetical protein